MDGYMYLPNLKLERYLTQTLFHHINMRFPGLQLICEEPFIFLVHNFLSPEECHELIRAFNVADGSETTKPSATAPEQQSLRNSTSHFPQKEDIGWLRERMASLTNVRPSQLEPTKVTRYTEDEYFRKHTDASFLNEKLFAYSARLAGVNEDGLQDPCGWPSRFCTCFLYLNDCAAGGRTRFGWLDGSNSIPGSGIFSQSMDAATAATATCDGLVSSNASAGSTAHSPGSGTTAAGERDLSIAPREGMAVIHFPTTTLEAGGCIPDPRTMHESEAAIDTKYIVQQFIWPCAIDAGACEDDSVHEDVRKEWAAIMQAGSASPSTG